MKVINLTTHDVCVKNKFGRDVVYPQSGFIARAISQYSHYGTIDNDVVIEKEVEPKLDFGVQKIEPYAMYIVSYQFAMKLKNINHKLKHQFVYPSACKAEREEGTGKILSVPSLVAIQ